MTQLKKTLPAFYWEIQKKQKWISTLLFFLLFVFYLLTLGLISGSILLSLSFFLPGFSLLAGPSFIKYTVIAFLLSLVLTLINFLQAKKRGVQYILKNLRACSPDPEDRYHLSFLNVLEEMKISSGLPELRGYVIPTVNLNALSLIGTDKQPAIVVTEGILAETSRDELQAVVAHETAHILRGDTFLLTVVCSIAAFYEELIDSLDRQDELSQADFRQRRKGRGPGQPFVYLASLFSYLLLNFFITIISQKRELLADATAVELCRDPLALARVIYKAQIANSCLGDSSVFIPLFLVPPDSRDIGETTRDKLFNTHPPVSLRLQLLAEMAHKSLKEVIEEVKLREEQRERARTRYDPLYDSSPESLGEINKLKHQARENLEKDSIWLARNACGRWEGPYGLGSLITLPYFTPATRIKNIKENLEGPARNFPQIRFALYRQLKKQPLDPARLDKCPACGTSLVGAYYEGVKIKKCPTCQGKLVAINDLEKIFARREISFPESLKQKALAYREILLNPRIKPLALRQKPSSICPGCGLQFTLRPFSYHYLLPVYKCYQCQVIWFEDQELELLQIMIEEKTLAGRV